MKKSWILLISFSFLLILVMNSCLAIYKPSVIWESGKHYYDRKNYSMAIKCFKQATEKDPNGGDYFRWLGHAYYENRQYQDAVGAYKRALSLPHKKDLEHESWLWMSEGYRQLGQLDSAISSRKKYIELKPDDPNGFSWLAYLYLGTNQFDEAITAAKRAIELKADSDFAYYCLGVAYGLKKQYNEAFNAIKKAIEIDPANALFRIEMGDLFAENDDYAEAIEAYKKAAELQPADIDNLIRISNCYRLMGKYDDAIAAVNRAIELETVAGVGIQKRYKDDKSAAISFAIRSLILRSKGNQEESFKDAEKAYSLDSANDWALYSLGAAYLDGGIYNSAIKLFAQQKDSPGVRLLWATAYAKQGKIKEAENIYFSIPEGEISPKNIRQMNDRAALLQIFKPIVKQHRDKARSLEAGGQDQEALFELSEALKISDETEGQAIQESIFSLVGRAPSLSGMLPEEARECVLRGEMLVKEGNFEKAAGEYKKAIRIAPYATRLYYNSALIYKELKKYPEAIHQMNLYLKAVPDAPDARAAKDEIIKWKFMMEKEGGN